jgi:hypothetical protein
MSRSLLPGLLLRAIHQQDKVVASTKSAWSVSRQ